MLACYMALEYRTRFYHIGRMRQFLKAKKKFNQTCSKMTSQVQPRIDLSVLLRTLLLLNHYRTK